jgi:hypothetical protein
VDDTSAHHGEHGSDSLDLLIGNFGWIEKIAAEHNDIAELSGLDRSELVLFVKFFR